MSTSLLALALLASAADPTRFAFVGLHGGVFQEMQKFQGQLGVELEYLDDDTVLAGKVDPTRYKAIFVELAHAEQQDAWRSIAARAGSTHLVALQAYVADSVHDSRGGRILEVDPTLSTYYGASTENLRRLLVYALSKYAGRNVSVEPPDTTVHFGLYHPDHPGLFGTVTEFLDWARANGRSTTAPRVAVVVHGLHLELQQPEVVKALIRRFEQDGVLAVAVTDTGEGLGALQDRYAAIMLELAPGAVVHTCHSLDTLDLREKEGVPHLHSIFFRKKSIDGWRASADGVDSSEWTFQVATQELLGAIEPQVGAGTPTGGGGPEAFLPIPERIDHLVKRTEGWLKLRTTPAADKKVAVVYYDRELGKGSLMRGSASGMFLNAPRSLVALLGRMKQDGYTIDPLPKDEKELLGWLEERGRQTGMLSDAELQRLVRDGSPALVPVEAYAAWLTQKVPEKERKELEARWGPAPGNLMVWTDPQGRRFIVIPRVTLGNVTLLPQPLRGEAKDPNALVHDHHIPPPHNYLATYFWLEKSLRADAVVHFGTHGSEFLLPGKTVGLSGDDWTDIILGALPNVTLWVVNNLGESSPAKRRAYAVLVSHQVPAIATAGLPDDLQNLHDDIEKWERLEAGALKQQFQKRLTEAIRKSDLVKDLHLSLPEGAVASDKDIDAVNTYLHQTSEEKVPEGLHTLGEAPTDAQLVPYLVASIGKRLLQELDPLLGGPRAPDHRPAFLRQKAEAVVGDVVRKGAAPRMALLQAGAHVGAEVPEALARDLKLAGTLAAGLKQAPQEIDGLLGALAGKFVEPGAGGTPLRNPGSVPTGRNLYLLNPEEVPSHASWDLARGLVDPMLEKYKAEHGNYPRKIAFSLSSFATFEDYGVMEGQILYLMGVEPIWDDKNRVEDVRLIPRQKLGRPRVDVFLSALSYYRDNLPSRMVLLDKAIRLAAAADEPDNGVRSGTAAVEKALLAKGMAPEKAANLAAARIFGYAPGEYSTAAYYYLVERSGEWNSRDDLADAYLAQVRHVYSGGVWGEEEPDVYNAAIQGTDVVLRTWNDPVRSPLSDKYTWYTGGSLALAVEKLTGKVPEYLLSDVRDPDSSRMVSSEEALHSELRVRLFNRSWLEKMKAEGYAGADQMAVMVSNTFGWRIMRQDSVDDATWNRIASTLVDDDQHLGLKEFFEKENPWAFQDLSEVLLEAARKGYWKADAKRLATIAAAYRESVARHGDGGGMRSMNNRNLSTFVSQALGESGTGQAAGGGKGPGATEHVKGTVLQSSRDLAPWLALAGALLFFTFGFVRRKGVP